MESLRTQRDVLGNHSGIAYLVSIKHAYSMRLVRISSVDIAPFILIFHHPHQPYLITMNDNSFSFSSNVFGIIVGGMSLIALAFGLHMHLPSKRIKYLESILDETDTLFKSALEDGLLPEQNFTSRAADRLSKLRERTLVLRPRAYHATTWVQVCKELLKGLSLNIGKICYQVEELRAEIITSSEAQRRTLSARRDAATSSASPSSHVISPVIQ
ncbi:hypothetical protein F5I97DRAFT_819440 [Phlebopus sp. FC_14]|nr:hypothetical protein F5I97DRAFT_819440 [Phlebopus sp. FC_14]